MMETGDRLRNRPRTIGVGRAAGLTVVALLVLRLASLPTEWRVAAYCLVGIGWLVAGARWATRRFGKVVLLILASLGLAVVGIASYSYWQDGVNRQLVAQIKDLHAFYVGTTGTLLTGEVDYVYFDEEASDEQVARFTQLEGLDGLKRLVVKGTRVTDGTARKFGRFSRLTQLYLEGTEVSPAVLKELRLEVPNCEIEVR